jgi:transcriptional regulator with XRE-family HTH domain
MIDIRAAREKLGLTQAELAERLQLPANTLARWERGELKIERPELLRLAIEHLNCRTRRKKH